MQFNYLSHMEHVNKTEYFYIIISTMSTPLHFASCCDNTDAMQLLIEAGADIDARSDIGLTPLHWAALCGNTAAIQLLIGAGANVT